MPTQYFVDSIHGNDASTGHSPEQAWATLDRANAVLYQPGDRVFLKSGSRWHGQHFAPRGGGGIVDGVVQPVILDQYGPGPLPRIDVDGAHTAGILLENVACWEIYNVEITNTAAERAYRFGIHIHAVDVGEVCHLYIRDCFLHDIHGLLDNPHKYNGGIYVEADGTGATATWFDDVRIENNTLRHIDRTGINTGSIYYGRYGKGTLPWKGSTRVVIRNNTLDDIAGDGIVLCECVGGLVDGNFVRGCNSRSGGSYNAAIWAWDCDDCVIQRNEVCFTHAPSDGMAFDIDHYNNRIIVQHNYSHDNEGGFVMLIGNHYNRGGIVRYNISQNDGGSIFTIHGPDVRDFAIYNNTIFTPPGNTAALVSAPYGSDPAAGCGRVANNIFYHLGSGGYGKGFDQLLHWEANAFYGNHPPGEPIDHRSISADPRLAAPGSGETGGDQTGPRYLAGYRLLPGSPCIGAGVAVVGPPATDFWGTPVSPVAPNIGANAGR